MTWSNVIVLDQGTHSTRVIIYNHLGESIFKSQNEVEIYYQNSTHIEQDGIEILNTCKNVLHDAHSFIKKNNLENVCVAISTQRSTVLAWDANSGNAITPALSWLDTRAQEELENILVKEEVVREKTGLPLSPHYGASKLRWLLEHDNNVKIAVRKNQLKFGPLAAFLIFNLIKNCPCYVDYSNAHRTLLWNLQTKKWDEDLLSAFNINTQFLPEPVPSAFEFGCLKQFDYPLVLVNGDQNSAVYGYGRLKSNTTFINMGTGAFVLSKTQQRPVLNTELLASITYSSSYEQEYALEGTVNGAGAAMTWAEQEWGIQNIEQVPWKDVKDVPIFLNSIGGLGSPFWKSEIQPRFINKSHKEYSDQECMAALMESIVFLISINIDTMRELGIQIDELLVAGGMSKDEYLCQRLADLNEIAVCVSDFKEATSRGAAWLAMQKPEWHILESKHFYPASNNSIKERYRKFKTAIQGLVH